ncbi:MAG: hypothetical protein U0892_14900 [Pirellulales bacterium]
MRLHLIYLPLVVLSLSSTVVADDLWIASGEEYRGRLRISEGGTNPRVIYTRATIPNPAFPNAVTRVAQIAEGPKGEVFFCSGLDSSVMQLLDGKHEIQLFEHNGQVRDLACSNEPHTIYFSVVNTPQNSEPLLDGKIFRRDLWQGEATEIASIKQSDVGGNWWGTFTIREGAVYLTTLDKPSKIFKLSGGKLQPVFTSNPHSITGLSVAGGGEFLFADGSGHVRMTTDFNIVTDVLSTDLKLTDVNSRALETSDAP